MDREDTDGHHLRDGCHVLFDDHGFYLAVLPHVLAHVADLPQLMQQIRRVLASGGKLFICQSNRYGWWKYWGYYIKRNDRALRYRTFSTWYVEDFLRERGFEICAMKSPYYFYLHSKFSELCCDFDRKYGNRMPRWIATQWLITSERAERVSASPKAMRLSMALGLFVETFAFVYHALMKGFELVARGLAHSA